jgi:helicase
MAINAAFIGIDKHLDPAARDLTGARRDAVGLWSLFSDTIPDLAATLLVDDQVTIVAVRQAVQQTWARPDRRTR